MDIVTSSAPGRLRRLLGSGTTVVPGVHDALSARLADALGFPALYVTGSGLEASLRGAPDIGLLSSAEAIGMAGQIARTVQVPVLGDAETGFGGPINVWDTIRRFEQAGVAGVHLEDQAQPKKCGLIEGRAVVDPQVMEERIRAATDARIDPDFVVIARSDTYRDHGVAEVVRRCTRYVEAGADLILFGEAYPEEDLATLAREVPGPTAMCAGLPGLPAHNLPLHRYEEMGLSLVLYPVIPVLAAARAMTETYGGIAAVARSGGVLDTTGQMTMDELFGALGITRWLELESRFQH